MWGKIDGMFTVEAAGRLFHAFERALRSKGEGRVSMVIDCRAMVEYTTEARTAFTDWMTDQREHIERVAIVTPKTFWHMAIATVSLVSRIPMRGFPTVTEAEEWIGPSVRIDA